MKIITDKDSIIADLQTTTTIRTRFARQAEQLPLNVTLSFLGVDIQTLLGWATKERIIAFQRTLRQMPNEESFRAFHEAGPDISILALQAGLPLAQHTDKQQLIQTLKDQTL